VTRARTGPDEPPFRALVESSPDAVTLLDRAGIVRYENPATSRVLGYPPHQLVGTNAFDLVHPDDLERLTGALSQALDDGAPTPTLEFRFRHCDGSWRTLESLAQPLARDDGDGGYVVCARDVSDRVRIGDHQRQAHKMEAVAKLAGGVAYDFNNLLTIIVGRSELVLSRMPHDDAIRRNVELIQKTAERAASLTRQLLAFSRRQMLAPKVVDLNQLLGAMAPMLRRLIGDQIDLALLPAETIGRVSVDPGQIEQIVMNLAVNARDAMGEGGRLVIETGNIELDDEYARRNPGARPGLYVMLSVADTGSGMDPETQTHVFEPFFTTKELGKGTGLGLSTVYGMVKQSNGYIALESEPGEGSIFRIYFPRVADAAAPLEPSRPVPPSVRGSETILLVEDEEGVRELVAETLQSQGYRVIEAPHGGHALEICEQHQGRIDLMLTDVVMPQMSGRELAERVRPLRPDMKVMFVSGYTDISIVHHGILEANAPFLPKPFTPDALARKVREVLNR
jgi:PAS domain S-box-containing protein